MKILRPYLDAKMGIRMFKISVASSVSLITSQKKKLGVVRSRNAVAIVQPTGYL